MTRERNRESSFDTVLATFRIVGRRKVGFMPQYGVDQSRYRMTVQPRQDVGAFFVGTRSNRNMAGEFPTSRALTSVRRHPRVFRVGRKTAACRCSPRSTRVHFAVRLYFG